MKMHVISMKTKKYFSFALAIALSLVFSVNSFAASADSKVIAPRVLDGFDFSLFVSTDDDNAMTEYSYRDTSVFGWSDANIGFYSLRNAANSMHFKVLKYNASNNTISGTATNTVTPSSDSITELHPRYNDTYWQMAGTYKLYAWTTIRDCAATGRWTA